MGTRDVRAGTECRRFLPFVLAVPAILLSGCMSAQQMEKEAAGAVPNLAALNSSSFPKISMPWMPTKPSAFLNCPPGYRSPTSEDDLVHNHSVRAIAECGVRCDRFDDCPAFRYNPGSRTCELLRGNESRRSDEYTQICEKQVLRHFEKADAGLYRSDEFVEQEGAELPLGSDIGLYALGSSSLVWMTWVDQVHLTLRRLGYRVPIVPAQRTPETYPRLVPTCDDTKYYSHLKTSRFGRIGWSSWDFALNGWKGCGDDGYREVKGLRIKCQHGAGCVFSKNPVYVDDLARDASYSNITFLATWFNDDQHWSTHFKCFGGHKTDWKDMLPVTSYCLLSTIRKIHERSPHTWIVVLAKYPETFKHKTFKFIKDYNLKVKEEVEKEPRTLLVDYYMPNDLEGEFYQSPAHGGHPNCRGSKLIAHAVVDRLYKAKVLSRSLKMVNQTKANLLNDKCGDMDKAACHTSGFCWVDPADRKCKGYQPGFFTKGGKHFLKK